MITFLSAFQEIQIFCFSRDDPRYNLASSVYSTRWEEGVFRLSSDGHCHSFNPENVSLSGLKGQHYVTLGQSVTLY